MITQQNVDVLPVYHDPSSNKYHSLILALLLILRFAKMEQEIKAKRGLQIPEQHSMGKKRKHIFFEP